MSSSSRGYLGNLLNQFASGVSNHISQLDDGIQNVAQNIGEAIRGQTEVPGTGVASSSNSSSTTSQATTPDADQPSKGGGSSGKPRSAQHPFNLFMGNGGLCGRTNRSATSDNDPSCGRQPAEMPCDECNVKFSLFARKRECPECRQYFCDACFASSSALASGGIPSEAAGRRVKKICERCRVLLRCPPIRADLMELRVIDLKRYLTSKKISVKNCVEKKDLVELVVRENGGGIEQHSGSIGRRPSSPLSTQQPSGSRPVERQERNFPKSYVQSTHRQEWFDSMEREPSISGSEADADQTPVEEIRSQDAEPTPGPDATSPVEDVVPGSLDEERDDGVMLSTSLPASQGAASGPLGTSAAVDRLRPETSETKDRSSSMPSSPKRFANHQGLIQLSEIESMADLRELSVKQCKEILALNRVNFKGVVEKEELLKMLERLWKQDQRLKEGKDEMEDDDLCKICMDNPVDCVMLECGHMCTCTSCGKLMNECPICRQYVVRVVKIFKA